MIAINNIDKVIAIIRASKNPRWLGKIDEKFKLTENSGPSYFGYASSKAYQFRDNEFRKRVQRSKKDR